MKSAKWEMKNEKNLSRHAVLMGLFFVLCFAFCILHFAIAPSAAHAAPLLVCDPQEGVLTYDVETDGVVVANLAYTIHTDGSHVLRDLAVLRGRHTFRVRANGDYGSSDWTVPLSVVVRPGEPNVRIVKE